MGSKKKILFSFFAMALMLLACIGSTNYVYAGSEDSVQVTEIDYENLTLTVQGSGDSVFYFSDSRQKSWERVEGTGSSVTMDISWIPVSKNYVLSLKGNVSTKPITVTLPKYNSVFKAKYDRAAGTVSYTGIDANYQGKIQWRVKGTTEWNETTVSDASLKSKLDFYINEMAAATIYFRTAPVEGNSATNTGARPSKEVAISLTKKTAAPAVTVDGSAFKVKVPKGVSYRMVGSPSWTVIDGTELDLTQVAAKVFYSASNQTTADQMIEFRKDATAKTQVSASKFLRLNAQQSTQDVGLTADQITTVYLSPKTVQVTVKLNDSLKNNTYEYGVLKADSDKVSKWTALAVKSNEITKTFNSTELPADSTLRIRKKTSGKSGADDFLFASQVYDIKIVGYPGSSQAGEEAEDIVAIRGTEYTSANNITLSYKVDENVKGDVEVTSIGLYKNKEDDKAVTTLPEKQFSSKKAGEGADVSAIPEGTYQVDIEGKGITSLLGDTKLATDTKYYFGLNLKNGERIMTKMTLTVLPDTKITGTKEFVKIAGYEKQISFTLNYGSKDPAEYDVSVICGNSSPITVEEANKKTTEKDGTYTQTINLDVLDSYFPAGEANADVVVSVANASNDKLSEKLEGISITLKQPVEKSGSTSGSISFSEGYYTKDIVLTLKLLEDPQVKENFGVTDVTWGRYSLRDRFIAEQETNENGAFVTLTISQNTLNKLKEGSNFIAVEINDGDYVFQTSYKVTVLGSSQTDENGATTAGLERNASFRLMSASSRSGNSNKIIVQNIDYAKNEMTLDLNGNAMALYSVNKKTWYSIGETKVGSNYVFNLSWVADTKDYTIYFKDVYATSEEEYTQVKIPKKNTKVKVTFNKLSGGDAPTLTVKDAGGTALQWRKNGAYEWNNVKIPDDGLLTISGLESLRVKGGKIIARVAAVNGAADSAGARYSKEVTVSIPKRVNAPTVKINVSKLNLNTTTAMEYYDTEKGAWTPCTKTMSLWDIKQVSSNAAADAAGSDVTVLFRRAATKSAGYSKTFELVVKKQAAAPSIGNDESNDVIYSTEEKTVSKKQVTYYYLNFKNASRTNRYQYVIVPDGTQFNEATAKWSTVSKATKVTLSRTRAVPGAKIYVRVLGTASTATAPAQLSSAVAYYVIPQSAA